MKTRKKINIKMILSIMLAIVVAGGFGFPFMNAYAAGGNAIVNLGEITDLPSGTSFDFDIYKVGDYTHDSDGKAVFELNGAYASSGADVKIPNQDEFDPDEHGGTSWEQTWLDSANTLATFIDGMDSKPTPDATMTIASGGSGSAYLSSNGLYLLVGKTTIVDNVRWTPQPMFISILNGDNTFDMNNEVAVKMKSEVIVFEHSLLKIWNGLDETLEEMVKPKEIKVKICYGGETIDTVTLNDDNDWSWAWTSTETGDTYTYNYKDGDEEKTIEFKPNKDDPKWTVVEVRDVNDSSKPDAADIAKLRYFNVSYENNNEQHTITNTFTTKSLILNKSLDGYDDEGHNVTLSFKIIGKNAADEVVYTNHLGISFSKKEDLEKPATLSYIPSDVVKIEVEEEYSANYEQDGDPEITYDEDTGTWTVVMKNKHSDHGPKGGVVNKYEHGKDPAQQGI